MSGLTRNDVIRFFPRRKLGILPLEYLYLLICFGFSFSSRMLVVQIWTIPEEFSQIWDLPVCRFFLMHEEGTDVVIARHIKR